MPYSQLEQFWNENQPLENLKLMDLDRSSKLILSDFDFSNLPNLEVLNLGWLFSIRTLPSSIGFLSQLVNLSLIFCTRLTCLPDSIGELKSLAELDLSCCTDLASLPSSIGQLKSLVMLDLSCCTKLASLPRSIGQLKCLVKLALIYCLELASLPESIGELKSLVELYVTDCSKLASLPSSIGGLKSLVKLNLRNSELASLPESIGELKSLETLDLSNCSKLASLPESIGELKSLETLVLSYCSKLESLPNSIHGLESLNLLKLEACDMLNGFPILNPRCSEVEEITSTTNKLGCLQHLNMSDCHALEIPGIIGSWVSLKILIFSHNDFERIPASIKQFPVLIKLDLSYCKRLQHLPQLPSSLRVLIASKCISLTSVEGIFVQGEKDYEVASQEFNFSGCSQLDQNSLTKIIGDARLRIERMATSLFNQQYFGMPISVRLCIPGSEVPEWFTYKNTEGPTVKIKLPDHWHRANTTDQLFGFTLCAVVSFVSREAGYRNDFDIKCECHLITKDGTQSDLSFHYYDEKEYDSWEREHVFIWSIHSHHSFKEASFHFISSYAVVHSGVHPLFVEDYIDKPEQQQPKRLKLMGNA